MRLIPRFLAKCAGVLVAATSALTASLRARIPGHHYQPCSEDCRRLQLGCVHFFFFLLSTSAGLHVFYHSFNVTQKDVITVAILAQGTHWADALAQAYSITVLRLLSQTLPGLEPLSFQAGAWSHCNRPCG